MIEHIKMLKSELGTIGGGKWTLTWHIIAIGFSLQQTKLIRFDAQIGTAVPAKIHTTCVIDMLQHVFKKMQHFCWL